MTSRFAEKVALVTGAGSGMGRAITIRLAEEGASVLAVDIDGDGLDETLLRRVGKRDGAPSRRQRPAGVRRRSMRPSASSGGWTCSATWPASTGPAASTEMTLEQYRRLMGVNLDGYFFLAQAAIPHLLETGGQHREHRVQRRSAGRAVLGGVLA